MNNKFETSIGLEIHIQLKTKSKMFCGCENTDDLKPNTSICPICLGMPGTLPVANIDAIEKTIKIGLALNSEIASNSKFDRKHYFYPDLPKGYQISQYDQPFAKGGWLELVAENENRKIRLNRVHLEEDAGKLIHDLYSNFTVVDLNRAGTPLAEIVTEPDIKNPREAKEFLQELRLILRKIGVSDADMEKGHLRCDANISVSNSEANGSKMMSEIVEIKNLNSFKFVEKALSIEEKHLQKRYPNWPKTITKQTHGFDSKKVTTYILREKEEAKDYRYFPEPDLPPFDLSTEEFKEKINTLKNELKNILPSARRLSLRELGLSPQEIEYIIKTPHILEKVEKISRSKPELVSKAAKILINEKASVDLSFEQLVDLVELIKKNNLTSNVSRNIVLDSIKKNKLPSEIFVETPTQNFSEIYDKVITENLEVVEKIRHGKAQSIGFLIGEVMKKTKGSANPNDIRDNLIKRINNS